MTMTRKTGLLFLALMVGFGLTLIVSLGPGLQAQADAFAPPMPASRSKPSSQPVFSAGAPDEDAAVPLLDAAAAAAGDVIEVFTNTWSYSTLGLVYDPGRDHVRYAHESQSSSHNPTIYDVDAPVSHTLLFSVALSTQNSGWPWQLDNRTGAGYDFVADTYFLPDYNGDLSYSDDNIVEIDVDGTILNAWEMDDEVNSNDSSDGSEIDSIIDIAVVPGTPTRYFATAAYDDNVVYEIVLTKTGTLWTPNSWRTVATYTLPIWSATNDNLGIDYDAENEVLYHSSWDTTTVLITDLNMHAITSVSPTFDCPGAGGYNSGITFIEGSSPPEVWVTDFSSDQTMRCESPLGSIPLTADWEKWVAGQPWDPDGVVVTQTGQIVQVTDIITAEQAFTLTERWDHERLTLIGLDVFPPAGQIVTGTGSLDVIGPAGPPERIVVDKWFRVEPCTWITTTLEEELVVEDGPLFAVRPVTITKLAPELHIDSTYNTQVFPGSIASFTLSYSNTGGFENDVWISNTFPISAPFVYADPFPDYVGPDGLSARWDVGNLPQGDAGNIDVYVFISETVPALGWITIWDDIFNHVDVLQERTLIEFQVTLDSFPADWEKLINGEPWHPGISVTLQTSQTLTIDEFVDPQGNPTGFSLLEEWNPSELALSFWSIDPITYATYVTDTVPGLWILAVPPGIDYGPFTVTKEFHVEPCNWPETILWESLQVWGQGVRNRPVVVAKQQPELWIDSFFDVSVYSADQAQFVLVYGNAGGLESQAWITNTFPAEAAFVESQPSPDVGGPGDTAVGWNVGELAQDGEGRITVTVDIAAGLPPSTTIEIWDGIFDHVGELADETLIEYHVPPPTWDKWVNGQSWTPDLGVTVQTGDTFTVTDVISTRSASAIVEHWNPEHLALTEYVTDALKAGIILSDTGFLSWEFPGGAPGQMTITKVFQIRPCTWTYTVLWEELWVEDVEWERRPVHIDKFIADMQIGSAYEPDIFAGQPVTFTLNYTNVGGIESWAWVTATFPISAPFAWADPVPDSLDPGGRWARWDVGPMAQWDRGSITVTVAITETLPPDTVVHVYGYIYDHVDDEHDWTDIVFVRGPSLYLPLVLRDFP